MEAKKQVEDMKKKLKSHDNYNEWVESKGKTASNFFIRLAESKTRTLKSEKYSSAIRAQK